MRMPRFGQLVIAVISVVCQKVREQQPFAGDAAFGAARTSTAAAAGADSPPSSSSSTSSAGAAKKGGCPSHLLKGDSRYFTEVIGGLGLGSGNAARSGPPAEPRAEDVEDVDQKTLEAYPATSMNSSTPALEHVRQTGTDLCLLRVLEGLLFTLENDGMLISNLTQRLFRLNLIPQFAARRCQTIKG
eukprot:g13475.t1